MRRSLQFNLVPVISKLIAANMNNIDPNAALSAQAGYLLDQEVRNVSSLLESFRTSNDAYNHNMDGRYATLLEQMAQVKGRLDGLVISNGGSEAAEIVGNLTAQMAALSSRMETEHAEQTAVLEAEGAARDAQVETLEAEYAAALTAARADWQGLLDAVKAAEDDRWAKHQPYHRAIIDALNEYAERIQSLEDAADATAAWLVDQTTFNNNASRSLGEASDRLTALETTIEGYSNNTLDLQLNLDAQTGMISEALTAVGTLQSQLDGRATRDGVVDGLLTSLTEAKDMLEAHALLLDTRMAALVARTGSLESGFANLNATVTDLLSRVVTAVFRVGANGLVPAPLAGDANNVLGGDGTWQVAYTARNPPTKLTVGLEAVNNTSDADKPISRATKVAIDSNTSAIAGVNTALGTTNATVAALNTTLQTTVASLSSLQTTVGNISTAVTTLQSAVNALQTTVATQTSDLTALKSTVSAHTTDVAALKATVADHTTSIASLNTTVATLAPKLSPAFTGVPTVPTAAKATNTTQIASTAFVQANLADRDARLLKVETDIAKIAGKILIIL